MKGELHDGYRLEERGDRFDLVHVSLAVISGRHLTMREIVRANIPDSEVRALSKEGDKP